MSNRRQSGVIRRTFLAACLFADCVGLVIAATGSAGVIPLGSTSGTMLELDRSAAAFSMIAVGLLLSSGAVRARRVVLCPPLSAGRVAHGVGPGGQVDHLLVRWAAVLLPVEMRARYVEEWNEGVLACSGQSSQGRLRRHFELLECLKAAVVLAVILRRGR